MVIPISELSYGYAGEVRARVRADGFHADVDLKDAKMQKKVGRVEWLYEIGSGKQGKRCRDAEFGSQLDGRFHRGRVPYVVKVSQGGCWKCYGASRAGTLDAGATDADARLA